MNYPAAHFYFFRFSTFAARIIKQRYFGCKKAKFANPHYLVMAYIYCILTVLYFADNCVAQTNETFFEKARKDAQQGVPQNSPAWDRINELKMMRANSPGMESFYDQQINQIIQLYSPDSYNSNSAQDIIDQLNKQTMQAMGYNPPSIQAEIRASQQNQVNGKPPALTQQEKQQQQITDLLSDVNKTEPATSEYWKAPDFAEKEKPFYNALNNIKKQLDGEKSLSVKDAYYEVEYAWGDIFLTKKEYDNEVKKSVAFIKQWMIENKLDPKNNLSLHLAIQKFMTDTLSIGKNNYIEIQGIKPTTHLPFYYDYQDFKAEKDFRSYHVTKGFATGNGQCHVLPLIYACIAEALGAKFYLSYAPLHSFIKYPDNNGNIHDFEVTTNWQISDQWYKDNLYVKSLAEKSRIYLDTLNRKEIVAGALLDLAESYKEKVGIADGKFISQCVDCAMNYFPDKKANVDGWKLRSQIAAVKLNRLVAKKEVKTLSDVEQIPEAEVLLDSINTINLQMENMGYEEVPEKAYEEIMINCGKCKNPKLLHVNNLEKRNLFIPLTTEKP